MLLLTAVVTYLMRGQMKAALSAAGKASPPAAPSFRQIFKIPAGTEVYIGGTPQIYSFSDGAGVHTERFAVVATMPANEAFMREQGNSLLQSDGQCGVP